MAYTAHNIILPTAICLVFGLVAFNALAVTGTINDTYKYAWTENLGWLNFGSSQGVVTVTDSALTGYAWSETAGWVSLNCSNTSSCATVDYKVINSTSGYLGGYAWGENTGWINFAPTYGGVTINSLGHFNGYAWGENTGWIVFNCATVGSCATVEYRVQTDWQPSPTPTSGGGGPASSTSALPTSTTTSTPTDSISPSTSAMPSGTPLISTQPSPTGSSVPTNSATLAPSALPTNITIPTVPPPTTQPSGIPPAITQTPAPTDTPFIIQKIIGEPATRIIAKTVEKIKPIGIISGTAVAVSTVGNGISLLTSGVSILNYLQYLYQSLLILFGLKKRGKPWGTVYDSFTKQPLPFVRVQILNKENRVLETKITDRNGRYNFLATTETISSTMLEFSLRVIKDGYIFPAQHVHGQTDTILYDHVYLGGFVSRRPDETVNFDIPIDPLVLSAVAVQTKLPAMRLHNILVMSADIAFWVALVILPLTALFHPTPFNLSMLVLFAIVNGLRIIGDLRERPYGIVYDAIAGHPMSYALVTLKDAAGVRKGFAVSDESGRYILLTEKGVFDLDAVTPADIQPQRSTRESVSAKRGWVAQQVSL